MAQGIPTLAELTDAQAKLDAYNAATGDNLKLEWPAAQPIAPDARDRLARHLGMQSVASPDECLRQADELLAVITGQEG